MQHTLFSWCRSRYNLSIEVVKHNKTKKILTTQQGLTRCWVRCSFHCSAHLSTVLPNCVRCQMTYALKILKVLPNIAANHNCQPDKNTLLWCLQISNRNNNNNKATNNSKSTKSAVQPNWRKKKKIIPLHIGSDSRDKFDNRRPITAARQQQCANSRLR